MSFNDGDFVKIDYSARRASDKSLVYTTIEKVAKEGEFESEGAKYGPQLIVVGKNTAIKGVNDAVKGMSVGEEKKVEIEPLNAFGERREDMVTVMRVEDFRSREMDPHPGMQVNIDGTIATIKSVNSGRVVVDANHPLAGEKLVYDIKVVGKIEKENEKIVALADHNGLTASQVEVTGSTAKVTFDSKIKKDNGDYFVSKATFVETAFKFLPGLEKIVVDEEYVREKGKKAA